MTTRHRTNPYVRIEQVLGGASLHIETPIDLHEQIARGLPRRMAVHLLNGLSTLKLDEGVRALGLSTRTWHRIKSDTSEDAAQRLDADQSARVWNLAEVLTKAEEVLGTREAAEQWLARPAIGLNSRRPIDLMTTAQGAELVKTLLDQMEYGVYA